MRKKLSDSSTRLLVIVALTLVVSFLTYAHTPAAQGIKNFADSSLINRGVGWKDNESLYAGSELNFMFSRSREVDFEFETTSKSDQGVEIFVDGKGYSLSSPNLDSQKLSISVDKTSAHTVTVRHTCSHFYFPCQIRMKGIYLEGNAHLFQYRLHNKILSVLGDSISTVYGKDNYSQILADDIGYELHNASIIQSTVSQMKGVDNAIYRYRKDLLSFKSDAIIIFLGTNDAAGNVNLDNFERDYYKIVGDVKHFNSGAKIFLVSTLPRRDIDKGQLENYNRIIRKISDEYGAYFVDPYSWLVNGDFSDDIHPSLASQKKIAEHFSTILSPILK